MKQKIKKKEFNDLLIPIIFTLSILPFISRLILYSSGLSKYSWYSDNDIISDFFSYSKSYCFLIISVVCFILLIFMFLLYRSKIKEMNTFIPIGIYSFVLLLSILFSVDKYTSIVGGVSHYESFFVLLGYILMCIYAYQMVSSEHDYKTIVRCLFISLSAMCVIGFLQIIGKDPISFTCIQKLIMPRQYWNEYLGTISNRLTTNAVALTLSNPNYVSIFVSMFIPFFMVLLFSDEKRLNPNTCSTIDLYAGRSRQIGIRLKRISYLILIFALFIILIKTNARTGLISLSISVILLGYFYRSYIKQYWKLCLALFTISIVLFIGLDSINHYRFVKKLGATFQSFQSDQFDYSLEEIKTNKNNIMIRYKEKDLYLSYGDTSEHTLKFYNSDGKDITNLYHSQNKTLGITPFKYLEFSIETTDGQSNILAKLGRYNWRFCFDNKQGYLYINDFEKRVKLEKIDAFGFHNHENIASSRGYIWSRSLPLLKKYFLIGSGPDTFALVFPQWDYVGKSNNCKTPYTIIEKPHNLYLMIAIQTGIPSLFAFLYFYLSYMIKSIRIYRKRTFLDYTEKIGLGCLLATFSYMISGFFNDSSIQTSPIFWVLLGIGLSANHRLKTQVK